MPLTAVRLDPQAILDAPLPRVRRSDLRREPGKVQASEIRTLLRWMGFDCISVIAPKSPRARVVHVQMPAFTDDSVPRHAVVKKLTAVILAAFPDLDDRSDPQSDYFDYILSVH